ncbi:MAG: protein kinase [Chloroflexi bacterium]|nr:protein kinase [Chloroflexota bacterium]
MALQPGDLLRERYRILAVLGRGGMGSVYHALDTILNIEVAIKENIFVAREYAEQFQQEARLLASLRHPNLPRVTDYFVLKDQGQYLVMDYIEGEDLKTRVEREGKISVQEAVIIGLALCDALEYLHSQDPPVIHRDIKPGNVRITPEGHVFLVDFGLAKIGSWDQNTVTGAQAVTPGFSPPEQYGTSHTAPYSDIYSLGATLYMALTGEPPPDAFERALDHADLKPLDEVNPEVPPALAQIIETAMALQPSDRFASVTEMRAALLSLNLVPEQQQHLHDHAWEITPAPQVAAWRTAEARPLPDLHGTSPRDGDGELPPPGKPPSSPPPSGAEPPSGGGRWRGIVVLLFLIAAVLTAWYAANPASLKQVAAPLQRSVARFVVGRLPATPTPLPTATPQPTAVAQSTQTPLAVVVPPTATSTFTPSPTATREPTRTPTPTITPTPAPTPLGGGSGQLAFASVTHGTVQIWLMDLQGHLLQQLTDRAGGACQPAWTPDGQALAFIAPCGINAMRYPNAQIYLLHLDSGQIEELVPPDWGGYDPAFSPDGKYLAFTSLRSGIPQLYVLNLETRDIHPLLGPDVEGAQPAWSPDGRWLAFVGNLSSVSRIWLLPFDPGAETLPTPQPFSRSGNKANTHPTWAGNGTLLVYSQLNPNNPLPYLVRAPLEQEGLLETPLTVVGTAMKEPMASPDGRWLVFEGWQGDNHDIYIISVDGAQLSRLTTQGAFDFDPAWRPVVPRP